MQIAYHSKSKFGANFQKWVQNFLKIPTSIILHNYIEHALTSIKTNTYAVLRSFVAIGQKSRNQKSTFQFVLID